MQEGLHAKIRSVIIHYDWCISGFSFFDKEEALLWEVGITDSVYDVEKVLIDENEVIIGVVAKLWGSFKSVYTDF
jgi:hypothetical protein